MAHFSLMALGPLILIHCFFILAVSKKNFSVIDSIWGIGLMLIALIGIFLSKGENLIENIIALMVVIWALRLSLYIHRRNKGQAEDFRYSEMRKNWGNRANVMAYFKVYLLQFVLMLVVGLPLFAIHFTPDAQFGIKEGLGLFMWCFGLAFEAIGDQQKNKFKKIPANKLRVCREGLWSLCRHPNYFGEALLWWGIGVFCINADHWWAFIGPAFLHFSLLKISGVPLLEERQKNNPEYQAYMKETPRFIPSLSKILK